MRSLRSSAPAGERLPLRLAPEGASRRCNQSAEEQRERSDERDRREEECGHCARVALPLTHTVQRGECAGAHPLRRVVRAHEVLVLEEPVVVEIVEHPEARDDELLARRVPHPVGPQAGHAGPSSAQIASATLRPSTADETIPPAYPAPSPAG